MKMMKNALVILAGGSGKRYDSDIPKQYTLLDGKEVLHYCIETLQKSVKADRIIVVLNNDAKRIIDIKHLYDVDVIIGGEDRAHSFQNALDYVNQKYPECLNIIFHEAARLLIGPELIDMYYDLLSKYDYIETCAKITDSLGSYKIKAPNREDYYLIQSPEAYRLKILNRYFDCNSNIYYAANQFPDCVQGYRYFGINNNLKLTYKDDAVIIEAILKSRKG